MRRRVVGLLFALTSGFAPAAGAASLLTVGAVNADWTSTETTLGPGLVTEVDTDGRPGVEEIRWSSSMTLDQSGYRVDGAAPPSFDVAVGSEFLLGAFTHTNVRVWRDNPLLTAAWLDISASLSVDGTPLSAGTIRYHFLHSETPDGETSPNPDVVTIDVLPPPQRFVVGGQTLTLELLGFRQGGALVTSLLTPEDATNVADLVGILRAEPQPVPIPGTLTLLGSGVLTAAALLRRGRKG